ncbi:MAG: L-histidine N(alpha)-methyltransferase [Acidobacteriota bacterium]
MPSDSAGSARLVIHDRVAPRSENEFADDVRAGLTATPKRLVPKYFYDALGSHLFEAICLLPEYYLTRAESEILEQNSTEIIKQLNGGISLVELGSGSAVKSRFLIRELLKGQGSLHYQPIDISSTMLAESSAALLSEFPGLRITAIAGDYTQSLALTERSLEDTVLTLFLGSNIGNYDPADAGLLLRRLRSALRPGDGLLLGADLSKSSDVLEAAYDDSLGVTAAFNLNVLQRINRELGGTFDPRLFMHRARFKPEPGRVEMHLESRVDQEVAILGLELRIQFAQGETIHTENSYKYNLGQLANLADDAGFRVVRSWFDSGGRFSCNLWFAV